ncbi:MAG TPA: hypothetical protein VJI97_04460 [Candidatus Nanoarchaeia archaeon]|nr:hypothetical protein [Candidatus Nanoarchaeia archaeon]
MNRIRALEHRVRNIEMRNFSVESNKDWETSFTRRVLLAIFTYFSVGIYMYYINIPNPWINSIVPALAFLLSTLTLPIFKEAWLRSRK